MQFRTHPLTRWEIAIMVAGVIVCAMIGWLLGLVAICPETESLIRCTTPLK